jgi:hypothetical protein
LLLNVVVMIEKFCDEGGLQKKAKLKWDFDAKCGVWLQLAGDNGAPAPVKPQARHLPAAC